MPAARATTTRLMVEYLSEEQILYLHRAVIKAAGGRGGVRDRGLLRSALSRPAASFAGQDLHVSIAAKTAALMHALVSNHAFIDGNKRVAVAAAELFLQVNGRRLSADDQALEEVTMAAAAGGLGVEELRIWIEQRTRRE